MNTVRNWCVKMGFVYGGGVAVGAGGMMSAFKGLPLTCPPNRLLGRAFARLAEAIRGKNEIGNVFVQPDCIPRFAYKMAAHWLFRRTGRENGVKVD